MAPEPQDLLRTLVFLSIWNPGGLAHQTTITYRPGPEKPWESAITSIMRVWASAQTSGAKNAEATNDGKRAKEKK